MALPARVTVPETVEALAGDVIEITGGVMAPLITANCASTSSEELYPPKPEDS